MTCGLAECKLTQDRPGRALPSPRVLGPTAKVWTNYLSSVLSTLLCSILSGFKDGPVWCSALNAVSEVREVQFAVFKPFFRVFLVLLGL